MEATMLTKINKELQVEASQETAFKVFTQNMDAWWPKTHHIGSCAMVEQVLEPHKGGRWYSKHEDGSEVNVGYVAEYDPFGRLILAWQIDGNFKYDPELVTEVEVNFVAEGPRTTRVLFEHRDLQKLMGGAKVIADMDNGWGQIMNLYKHIADEA